jgi:uncharacterized tellurite resistance protein B-like protein
MLDSLKRFFAKAQGQDPQVLEQGQHGEHDLRVATCALLVEIGRIDETFTQEELDTVLSILKDKYDLSNEHADALLAEAEAELDKSLDLWQFAKLINENYTNDEKIEIVEILWRVVYVDGKMDQYEHYLMNKLKNLLRLDHKQLIDAKLKVLHGE